MNTKAQPRVNIYLRDVLASLVVFLVALPLCMGIAIACGVSPEVGIITGIVGGLVVGSVSGCPLQISGPAAGLVVIVTDLLHQHGLERLGAIVLIAGFLQFVAGLLHFAGWFRAVTPAIVNGMLTGIGILLFAGQFHVMVDDSTKGSGINNLISIPSAIWKGLVPNISTSHEEAAALGVATIVILVIWEKFAPKRMKLLPGSLIAVIAASILAAVFSLPVHYVSLPTNLLQSVHLPTFDQLWASFTDREVILDGMAVAFIAAAETLLTATAIDKMQTGQRTNYDRELASQGLGNMICGFLGALPMTGVMVRSGVNVNAGAKTRLSSILHGLWLLLFVTLLPSVVRLIPVSSLAALLVYTGYKLANFKVIKELAKYGRSEVAIYVTTVVCIVGADLLTGVVVGIALAIGKLLYSFSHLDIEIADDAPANRTNVWLTGSATFLSLPKLAVALESVRQETELHIHFEGLDYIDHACLDLLMSWDKQHQATGGSVVIDWSTLGAVFQERRKRPTSGGTKEFRKLSQESRTAAGVEGERGSAPTRLRSSTSGAHRAHASDGDHKKNTPV